VTWNYLNATILGTLPSVLAGPLLRRVDANSVTVWFALRRKATVALTVTDSLGNRMFGGQRDTIAVGANLHIVAVTAQRQTTESALVENVVYLYDAIFTYPAGTGSPPGPDNSIAAATNSASYNVTLAYDPYTKPSFCMPPADLNHVRILNGSCRKASGDGRDALAMVSSFIASSATTPLQRPHQLLLTGDQIYADDVAASLLLMLTDAATCLMGFDEVLPKVPPATASSLPPYSRRPILDAAGFSSEDLDSHLMSLGEYLCMYLFVWSDVLWPPSNLVPDVAAVDAVSVPFMSPDPPGKGIQGPLQYYINRNNDGIAADILKLTILRSSLQDVRRVLANVPVYTIFDDHEVTDDWNMTLDLSVRLHGTLLGQRVVQNALVAYSLCQHWGNVPAQFSASDATQAGTRLLALLDKQSALDYLNNSPAICRIVSVHTDVQIKAQGGVYHDQATATDSLTYNYTIDGPNYQVIVTDTRTWRAFPRGGGEAPDLLTPAQFKAQITSTTPTVLPDGSVLIVVVSTNAPPVVSIRSATEHDWLANYFEHYPDIHDSWDIPSTALDRLIKALSDKVPFNPGGRSSQVVLLSGDVHIGFASRLHYQATKRFEDTTSQHANVVIAQLVASSFKKQTDDTIGLQREGYTYAPHWYEKPMIAPHVTEYYVGWNVTPASGVNMGYWNGQALPLANASSVMLIAAGTAVLPQLSGLPANSLQQPLDFSYQLDYLTMSKGGRTPQEFQALPGVAPGTSAEERDESAHVYKIATANYRQYHSDPAIINHIIGVNNFGELTFIWPASGSRQVNHRIRFHSPGGEPLFVDYLINMEAVDSDHPANPQVFQVTP
jgi:hypothetical protein